MLVLSFQLVGRWLPKTVYKYEILVVDTGAKHGFEIEGDKLDYGRLLRGTLHYLHDD
jgi:hypothetical protein